MINNDLDLEIDFSAILKITNTGQEVKEELKDVLDYMSSYFTNLNSS